jgi:hypothetical protein
MIGKLLAATHRDKIASKACKNISLLSPLIMGCLLLGLKTIQEGKNGCSLAPTAMPT